MTKVVATAYYNLHVCSKLVKRSFTCIGINIEPNGSEDHLILIKEFKNDQDLDLYNWMTIPTSKTEAVDEPDEPDSVEPVSQAVAQAQRVGSIQMIDLTTNL
jgi:hypothetical protein